MILHETRLTGAALPRLQGDAGATPSRHRRRADRERERLALPASGKSSGGLSGCSSVTWLDKGVSAPMRPGRGAWV